MSITAITKLAGGLANVRHRLAIMRHRLSLARRPFLFHCRLRVLAVGVSFLFGFTLGFGYRLRPIVSGSCMKRFFGSGFLARLARFRQYPALAHNVSGMCSKSRPILCRSVSFPGLLSTKECEK
jgi:hypothetical protein